MSGFKVSTPNSPLEQRAYEQRLEQLGIQVRPDGTIDEQSLTRLELGDKTGVAALQAVTGPDGVLDAQAAAKLDANLKFIDRLVGKSGRVSADQSNAVRAASLAMDGLAKTLESTADRASRNEAPSQEQLERIGRNIEHVRKQWAPWTEAGANLANVDASALASFVASFGRLSQAGSALGIELSKQREAVLLGGSPAAKDLRATLAGLSSTIHQLDLIRDASLLVTGRIASEGAKSIDELLGILTNALVPAQKAALESAVEKAFRVKRMLEEVPGFATGPSVQSLASFVTDRFPARAEAALEKGAALLLLSYEIPSNFAPPNGRHQLVVTSLGLRTVGPDAASQTRAPTPSELSSAGLSWEQIEEATRSLLQRVTKHDALLEPQSVFLNKEDRLYTNGSRSSIDEKQLILDWSSAMKHADPKARAGEMARVFNEYASSMSAGEVRDFARRALTDMARQPVPHGDRLAHSQEQLVVMDTIISQLKRFPFYRSNLSGFNELSQAVRNHLYRGFFDSSHHQQWLDRWHIDSAFKYD